MKKKIKNKNRHNARKRLRNCLAHSRIWSWESETGEDGISPFHVEYKPALLLDWAPGDDATFRYLVDHAHNWKICVRALCWTGDDQWLETDMISTQTLKINDLMPIYQKMRAYVLNTCKQSQLADIGWIAQTFRKNSRIDNGWYRVHTGYANWERQTLYRLTQREHAEHLKAG